MPKFRFNFEIFLPLFLFRDSSFGLGFALEDMGDPIDPIEPIE